MRRAFSIRQQPEARIEEVTDLPTCRHHWLIEPPQGSTSRGLCKACGEIREFRNSSEDFVWDNDGGANRGGWGRLAVVPAQPEAASGDY